MMVKLTPFIWAVSLLPLMIFGYETVRDASVFMVHLAARPRAYRGLGLESHHCSGTSRQFCEYNWDHGDDLTSRRLSAPR